jgi:6-phospho-beta-glucosidase
VVVGGGSQFALGLSESLVDYAHDMLVDSTVVLLDIRQDHLDIVHTYATRLAEATGASIHFEKTLDRREAFDGADFILTTFRAGSHKQQLQDEEVPPRYGLQGNETVGIGGIFMACRVVPLLQGMCADAEELCPDAWIINYTNPTQYVADAVRRLSDLKIISLCDGYVGVASNLARLLDVDAEDIAIYPGGTNHALWIMRFTVRGQDGYPLLQRRLSELSQGEIDAMYHVPAEVTFNRVTVRRDEIYQQFPRGHYFPFDLKLYQALGLLPAPRYYWRYHLDQDAIIAAQRSGTYVSMAGFYIEHAVPRGFEGLEGRLAQAQENLEASRRKGGGGHGDLAVRVISAIANGVGETFVVNVPNRGAISNLPEEAIVEVAATVDATGAHPFAMGPLPKQLVGYQHSLILSQELAIDAALSGRRADLLRAILAHPLIHSLDAAEACMDELLQLQAQWLPQFDE